MVDDKDGTDESSSRAPAGGEARADEASAAPAPAEAFVKGLGLLLQAAVGTAESMRVGVEKAGVPKAFELPARSPRPTKAQGAPLGSRRA
jgi:hypothetical protein